MSQNGNLVPIALGSNQESRFGSSEETITRALIALANRGLQVARLSRFFRSPCFPAGAGPDYVNAVAMLRTDLPAGQILAVLHAVEADFGRERVQRWAQRVIDLDLLACGDMILPDASEQARWRDLPLDVQKRDAPGQLILPHPRIQDRAFVLVPLSDIAPDWVHPATGERICDLLDGLPKGDIDALSPM